ncbi:MAG: hypothetical protein O7149_05735 [Wolbachia endosymbiont of Hylaeus sinuatus]|nr:hypothetical protein [Wolbachia endosymbiont of Hylaeus sinuatus]
MLAGSRDTANESRYDGSRRHDVELALAILLYSPTQLDPSSQSTGMTKKGGYLDDGRRSYLDDIVYYTMFVQFWIKKLANKFINISIQLINAWFFTIFGKIFRLFY